MVERVTAYDSTTSDTSRSTAIPRSPFHGVVWDLSGVKGSRPGGAAASMCPASNTFSRAPSPSSCCQHASSGCPLLPRSLRPESATYEAVSRRREPSTRVDNVACSEVSICNKSKSSNVSRAALVCFSASPPQEGGMCPAFKSATGRNLWDHRF